MKNLVLILGVALFLVGCSSSSNPDTAMSKDEISKFNATPPADALAQAKADAGKSKPGEAAPAK